MIRYLYLWIDGPAGPFYWCGPRDLGPDDPNRLRRRPFALPENQARHVGPAVCRQLRAPVEAQEPIPGPEPGARWFPGMRYMAPRLRWRYDNSTGQAVEEPGGQQQHSDGEGYPARDTGATGCPTQGGFGAAS